MGGVSSVYRDRAIRMFTGISNDLSEESHLRQGRDLSGRGAEGEVDRIEGAAPPMRIAVLGFGQCPDRCAAAQNEYDGGDKKREVRNRRLCL